MRRSLLLTFALITVTLMAGIQQAAPTFGYRNILIIPVNLPLNGYHRGETVTFRVITRQAPGGADAPPLSNFPFWTNIYRPDGLLLAGKWYWRTDVNGEKIVDCVIPLSQPSGAYTFNAFLAQKLPDGTFDGDGYTFYVID